MQQQFRIFLIVMSIAICLPAISQETEKNVKVHLKDGSSLIGILLEDNDYFIKLVIQSMDTIDIGHKLILAIGEKVDREQHKKTPIPIKDRGIFVSVTCGSMEEGGGNFDGVRLGLVIGKRLNNRLNVGIDVGKQGHTFASNFAWGDSNFITAGIYAKYFLNTNTNRWFFDGSAGYGFAQGSENFQEYSHNYDGGVNLRFNFGRQWGLSKTSSFFIKAGMGYQHVTGDIFTDWNGPVTTSYRKEFIYPAFLIGFEF